MHGQVDAQVDIYSFEETLPKRKLYTELLMKPITF